MQQVLFWAYANCLPPAWHKRTSGRWQQIKMHIQFLCQIIAKSWPPSASPNKDVHQTFLHTHTTLSSKAPKHALAVLPSIFHLLLIFWVSLEPCLQCWVLPKHPPSWLHCCPPSQPQCRRATSHRPFSALYLKKATSNAGHCPRCSLSTGRQVLSSERGMTGRQRKMCTQTDFFQQLLSEAYSIRLVDPVRGI